MSFGDLNLPQLRSFERMQGPTSLAPLYLSQSHFLEIFVQPGQIQEFSELISLGQQIIFYITSRRSTTSVNSPRFYLTHSPFCEQFQEEPSLYKRLDGVEEAQAGEHCSQCKLPLLLAVQRKTLLSFNNRQQRHEC